MTFDNDTSRDREVKTFKLGAFHVFKPWPYHIAVIGWVRKGRKARFIEVNTYTFGLFFWGVMGAVTGFAACEIAFILAGV